MTGLVLALGCDSTAPGGGTGGAPPTETGGASTTGGVASSGGAPTTGGALATGGAIASGGAAMTGGASGTGGESGTGGASGSLSPVTLPDGVVAPSEPRLRFVGRWDTSDPAAPRANWTAIGVTIRFEGASVSVSLEDEQLDKGDEGTGNAYQARVDGGAPTLVWPSDAPVTLAEGLAPGVHEVELVRRTEGKYGITTIRGFQLPPGGVLHDAGPRPPRRLEVLGDSISAGLANEGTGWYTNATENGAAAFGPLLADALDAEIHVLARGGGTFYNEYWMPQPAFFDRTFGPRDVGGVLEHAPTSDNPLWDFARYQPDLFVLALGTNDFSAEYPHIDEADYVAAYAAFLGRVRVAYPSAWVLCLAPFKEGAPWDEARAYIPLAVAATADAKVFAVDPVGASAEERWLTYPADYVTGDEYHPNLAGHQKIAERLEAVVRQRLGW